MKRHLLLVVIFLLFAVGMIVGIGKLSAHDTSIFDTSAPYIASFPAPPSNDNPCSATPITTNLTCTYATYSNIDASDSGVDVPSCGSYSGADVWFTAIVPSSGEITIEAFTLRTTDWLNKVNFTVYQGTCDNLTEIGCFESVNPAFALTSGSFTGRTAGEILYIRVYDQGNITGDFQICSSGACADVIADAGTGGDQCGYDYLLSAVTPSVGAGTWTKTGGSGNATFAPDANTPGATVSVDDTGIYEFTWTVTNGTCESSDKINVDFSTPTFASPEDDKDICGLLTTISIKNPSVGDRLWSIKSGPGMAIIASPTGFVSNVGVSSYGRYVFNLEVTNGSCYSIDTLVVNFFETPSDASVGSAQNSCGTFVSEALGGNVPDIGIGTWSQVSGPGTTIFSDANLGTSTATVDAVGDYVYRWTISNGPCIVKTADVNVSFIAAPTTATVGGTRNVCGGLLSSGFGGNTPVVGVGTWSQISGPGSTIFGDENSGSSTATATQYGSYVYRWTIVNGACSSFADITVNYYETPDVASVGLNQDNCDKISTSLGGNNPSIGTGTWTQFSGTGTSTFSAPNSGSSTATASDYGTYVYRWTISNGTCASSSADVTVNYEEPPTTASVGTDQDNCGVLTSTSLDGNTPSSGSGLWTQVSGSGTTIFSNSILGTSTATVTQYGTYVYRWTISNGVCASTTADIIINFYESPISATVGSEQNICATDILTIQSTSLGGNTPTLPMIGTWSQFSGPGSTTFSDVNLGNATAKPTQFGTYVYRWTISNGTCTPTTADVTVNFFESPVLATVGADQDICSSDILTAQSASLGGNDPTLPMIGTWSQVSGPGSTTFSNSNSGSSTAKPDQFGVYVYRWTISNGTCASTTADVTLNYYQTPSIASTGADQEYCAVLTSASLGGNTPTVGSGVWSQVSGSGTTIFSNDLLGNSTATVTQYGNYVYRWTISNGTCTSSTADISVNFLESPAPATVGTDQNICSSDILTTQSASLGGNDPTSPMIGTWSQVSGPGSTTFSDVNLGNATAKPTQFGIYVYRWTISNGTCASTTADVTVNYYETPTVASVGADQDRCGVKTSLALGGNVATIGVGTWSQESGPGLSTFSDDNLASAIATVSNYGTYVYRWTITNGTCTSSSADVTITYYEDSDAATVGSDQERCGTLTSLILGGNAPSVGIGTWSQLSGPGSSVFSDANNGNSTVTVDTYGSYQYRWTLTNGPCVSSSAELTIDFQEQPIANAGLGGDECDLNFTLSATPSVGIGNWTKVSGTGNLSFSPNANDANATVTSDTYGSFTLRWTEVNGTCSDQDEITVNFYEQPIANAGLGGDECDLDFNLSAIQSVGTGTWSKVSGTGNLSFSPNANDANATVTSDTYGSFTLRWTEVNGTCSDQDEITVNFYEQPIANAGLGGDECDLDFNLSAIQSVGTGTWSKVSGTGNLSFSPNANDANATVTSDTYGSFTLRWTEVNGTCSDQDEITVDFYEQPIANAGSGGDECDLNITLSATPSVGTGTWTKISGTGNLSFSPNANDANATITSDTYGSFTLRWTEVNGTCSDQDEIAVDFYEQPIANAGSGGDECDLNITLSATPSVGTGAWTKISGTGNLSFSPNANNSNATVTSDTYGSFTLRWTEVNGTCSDQDEITVNFYEQPIANAGSGGDECDFDFNLSATQSVGTGTWTKVSGTGNLSFSPNANNPNATVTSDTYGSFTLRWTEVNGTCSDQDEITVNFFETPSIATVGTDQERCGVKTSLPLGGNTPTAGIGTWYQESGPGLSTFNNSNLGDAIATVSNYGTYVYRWTITNGTCTSSTADVTVTYYDNSEVATVGSNQERCGTLTSLILAGNSPSLGDGTWSQVSGPGSSVFSNENDGNATVTADTYGSYTYRWTLTSGPCVSSTAELIVTFYEQPSAANVGLNQDICGLSSSNALGGNTPSVGIGTWSQVSGPGSTVFSSVNDGNSTATANTYGTYIYRWSISNGICSANYDDISVTYYEIPTVATVGMDQDLCETFTSNNLGGNASVIGIGNWSQISGPGSTTFADVSNGNTTALVDSYGTYIYRWTIANGTCSTFEEIRVTYNDKPTIASTGTNQFICGVLSSASLGGNTPTIGIGNWTQVSGPGTTIFSLPNNGNSTASADTYGVYVYRWSISNGSCVPSFDDVTIEYKEAPSTATVGPDQNHCELLNSNPLNGNIPLIGIGEWSQLSGPGTSIFSAVNNGNSIATADIYGTYVYRWTIRNATCLSTADITVNYNTAPSSNAGLDDKLCGPSYQIMGSTSTNGSIVWSTSGDGSFNDNSIENPIYIRGISDTGVITLTKTVSNPSCVAAVDNMILTISSGPVVNAGSGGDECDLDFTLSAIPSVGTGIWTKVTGPGNINFTPNENTANAVASADSYGTYQLQWSESNDGCEDSEIITVNYYEQPNTDAGIGGDECDLDYQLTAKSSVGLGTWTKVSGPGNLIFSPNENDPNAIVSADLYGSYKLSWTETNGTCSDTDEIIVNLYEQPIANAGLGGDECDLDFNLTAIPSVGVGEWIQVGGVGLATFTPNKSDPNAIVNVDRFDTYQFEWKETNGVCSDSDIITVNFYLQPNSDAGSGSDVCGLTYNLSANASAGIGTWAISSGNGNASYTPNSNDPNAQVVVDTYGSYTFTWTENNGVCSNSDDITINFYEQPNANAGTNGESCSLEFQLNAISSAGIGSWNKINGQGNVTFVPNENDPDAKVMVDEYGTYQFSWTELNGICTDQDNITVEFAKQPIANAGIDLSLEYAEKTELNAQLSTIGTGEWFLIKGNATISDRFSPSTHVTELGIGENILEWIETNSFCVDSDEIKIAVSKIFIPNVITPNGDQNNEFFKIRGLENLENISLTILDRRGIEVYTSTDYRNDWNGKDRNGTDLVVDTYFYVLELNDGKIYKGYIVIKR
ncbi:MAG: gliding motility-associated C-terminal domain-containing protein [Labilibaculum sp.]|nr:gliding motility-associated C-terminal domain-containing protein [Labilibaculum sp.]MBI9058686.1 gliding motility-associated C-terminal domain-containing protein [Labilibaculum sp.]